MLMERAAALLRAPKLRVADLLVEARRPEEPGQGLRLQTLVRLRWLAVFGQTVAVLVVDLGFGFPLPLGACLAVIALSAWLNIFLSIRWRSSLRIDEWATALLLGYDIVQLAALLYLTGGIANPFAILFIVPVTVSASALSLSRTLWLGALTVLATTLIAFVRLPLPWRPGETIELPWLYLVGVWVAVVSSIVFSTLYASRIAREARQMSEALAATEMVLARGQQLSALDGLAAAAAHELGTPLATIALVAKELKRELKVEGHHAEDLDLLVSQSARCREILSRLADRGAEADALLARHRLSELLEEIVEPLRGPDITIVVEKHPAVGPGGALPEPVIARNPGIKYGLANLLENALDFAQSRVTVDIAWTATELGIVIADDGPGFAQAVIDRLGDPFVTTRKGYGSLDAPPEPGGHDGMGLGFFIAKTLLERTGASVALANKALPDHGASIRIDWPRATIEVAKP